MNTLFEQLTERPLADKLRPQSLDEVVGQEHLLADDAPLGRMIKTGKVSSFILWGPPGCGKTTIARLFGRYFINMIEAIDQYADPAEQLDVDQVSKIVQKRMPLYDKDREGHYNLISALHKSLRGSDPDAGLYWTARMIEGGEDPKYILRRLARFAVEDVSLADPQAIVQAIAAWDTYERLGSPEGELAIAQLVVYLATAPKSVGVYKAWSQAMRTAKETGSLSPPMHILNAPTKLMGALGYGEGYQYDPDTEDGFSGQNYFPELMRRCTFYRPVERGFEREIKKRLAYWEELRKKKCQKK